MCRQSMQMKWIDPSTLIAAMAIRAWVKKTMKAAGVISPDAMTNSRRGTLPLAPDIADHPDVIGRISEHHPGLLARHQHVVSARVASVAANEAVLAKDPECRPGG